MRDASRIGGGALLVGGLIGAILPVLARRVPFPSALRALQQFGRTYEKFIYSAAAIVLATGAALLSRKESEPDSPDESEDRVSDSSGEEEGDQLFGTMRNGEQEEVSDCVEEGDGLSAALAMFDPETSNPRQLFLHKSAEQLRDVETCLSAVKAARNNQRIAGCRRADTKLDLPALEGEMEFYVHWGLSFHLLGKGGTLSLTEGDRLLCVDNEKSGSFSFDCHFY